MAGGGSDVEQAPQDRPTHISARITRMSQTQIPAAKEQVIDLLRPVVEPESGMGIVDLGMVKDVVLENGRTTITIALLTRLSPSKEAIAQQMQAALAPAPDLGELEITWTFRVRSSGLGRSDAQPTKGVK